MLRKAITAVVIALFGMFSVSGVAAAAPGSITVYAPGGAITVVISDTTITVGGIVVFTGSGFLSGEVIIIVITYAGPNGLRSNHALQLAASSAGITTTADASGGFSADLSLTKTGLATITATGQTSGKTATLQVAVAGVGQTATAPSTTTVEPTTGESDTTGVVAAPGNGSAGGDGTGLASTGVSIAGPLTVGAAALMAGLGMLFFGTRLAIRRRHRPTAHM